MPPRLKELYSTSDLKDFGFKAESEQEAPKVINADPGSYVYHDIHQTEIPLTAPETNMLSSRLQINMHSHLENDELPPTQEYWDRPWQEFLFESEKYSIFRMYPKIDEFLRMMDVFASKIKEDNLQDVIKPVPSLYAYYSLLPDFIRSNPAVKNVYRKFETTKHSIPFERKQIALNYVAQFALPLHPRIVSVFLFLDNLL